MQSSASILAYIENYKTAMTIVAQLKNMINIQMVEDRVRRLDKVDGVDNISSGIIFVNIHKIQAKMKAYTLHI